MKDISANAPSQPKRRRWLRALIWTLGILIILIVAFYFVATSSAFLKGVILPRVSQQLHADVTVADASIHPFREISLRDLKVQAKGNEPLLTAPEVRLRYSLVDIIGGHIRVDEITLVDPTVSVVEHADGTRNLDPILDALKQKKPAEEKKQPSPAKPSKPIQIDLRSLTVSNATFRQEKLYAGGHHDLNELANVNVRLESLKNGQPGKLTLRADMQMAKEPPAPADHGLIQGSLTGSFGFTLSPDLKPVSLEGQSELILSRAEGAFSQFSGFKSALNCSLSATEIKEVALRFQRNNELLGELLARGPFDAQKTEGRLTVELNSIDKRLLNLFGAGSGIDFGTTAVNSTNVLQLSNSGSVLSAAGRFNLNRLQMTRTNQSTPELDLHADYDITVNSSQNQAQLRTVRLDGTQNGSPLLRGELTSPMTVSWGNGSNTAGDAAFALSITNLNLGDWKPFLGDTGPSGQARLNARLQSHGGGQQLQFDLDSEVKDLTANFGSNRIAGANILVQVRGQAADMKRFTLDEYKFQLTRQNDSALTVSGSGKYDTASQSADMQLTLEASVVKILALLPQPGMTVGSGSAELKAHLTQNQDTQTVTGSLRLTDFTGQFGSNNFTAFGTAMDLDVNKTPAQIKINRVAGNLTQNGKTGGSFDLSGTYDPANKSAALKVVLSDFNENGLRPFLEPALGGKKLVSIAINGTTSVQYDPSGNSAFQAALQITNLVVNDPQQKIPPTPLEAKLDLDASLQKQSADLRRFQITLTPTARAQNQVQLQGQIDFSNTNAIQGNVKLSSDSVDLTTYYDLFAANKSAAAKPQPAPREGQPPAPAQPSAPAAEANQEPAAKQLPFHNFNVQANIARFYLHEVEITNLQTTLNLDGGHVLLKPCQLSLNGAPMDATADVDLGVPGYKYSVSFNADQVPFAPLVDTFAPDRKGQLGGALTAHAKIDGTGTTGASLQKSLSGQFNIGTTNLNLSVVNVRSRLLKSIINVVATLPELLNNPMGAISTLFGSATGQSGLMNELSKSPIDVISARGSAGNGEVVLQQAFVQSAAFIAEATGKVTLAPVLTNSAIQIPVTLSLSRSIAQQLNLAENTNAPYSKLPSFLTLAGTCGDPQKKINGKALVGTTLRAVGGAVPGGKAGGVIQGLGGLLGGQTQGSTSSNTNAPSTKQTPVNNLLNNFFGPKKK